MKTRWCDNCQMLQALRHFQIKSRTKIEEIVAMSKMCRGLAQTFSKPVVDKSSFEGRWRI